MKSILLVGLLLLSSGDALSQERCDPGRTCPFSNTTEVVTWPQSCGSEPESFKSTWHPNHKKEMIRVICNDTTPVATARSAFDSQVRAAIARSRVTNSPSVYILVPR